LPISCEEVIKERRCISEYITSLLWSVYACLGFNSIIHVLARQEYLEELLKIKFLSNSESHFALGSRILKSMIPTQHSPQTLV